MSTSAKKQADEQGAVVRLPDVLDVKSADPLLRELLASRGQPIALDASGVQRLGGLGLQVLLSAQATWQADGHSLQITEASAALCESLRLFGADELLDLGGNS